MIFVFCSGQDGQNGGHFDYILSTLFISPPYMSNHRGYLSHLFDLFFSLAIYQSEKKIPSILLNTCIQQELWFSNIIPIFSLFFVCL